MTKFKSLHREIISLITYFASIIDACFLYPELQTEYKYQSSTIEENDWLHRTYTPSVSK